MQAQGKTLKEYKNIVIEISSWKLVDVLYFGEKRPIWELSKDLNTIPYEIISTLSRRIKRIYY